MLFLEYDVDEDSGDRISRWYYAYEGDGLVMLPLTVVDSGVKISYGRVDFYPVYKDMVETALARPAEADVVAHWWRSGEQVEVVVRVTNLLAETLGVVNYNNAALFALVYEENPIQLTGRFVHAVETTRVVELATNETHTYHFSLLVPPGIDWNKAHVVALVDFIPHGATHYVMLQAARAEPVVPELSAAPGVLTFLVDPADVAVPGQNVAVLGGGFFNWTATGDRPWLSITPSSGQWGDSTRVTIDRSSLTPGWQEGTVSVMAVDSPLSDQVIVRAYLGPLRRLYLPLTTR